MRILNLEVLAVGRPSGCGEGGEGELLVSPLNLLPERDMSTGDIFVGLRGGSAYAVLVRIFTDEGLYGIGSVGVGNGAAAYVIEEHLKPMLLGRDPFDVELLWESMYRGTLNYGRKGLVIEAISAVDIALWDIIGKATGQPVYRLLGGKTRDRIPVYASRLYARENLDLVAAEALSFVKMGFRALKQRFGYGPREGLVGMRKNVELIRTVRETVGPDIELMADAYMGWDVLYAIRMIRMIEDAGLNLKWVEEPVIADDIDGYAEIRRSVSTPISGGEHEFTRYGFRELIQRRAVDILQPDVNRIGGITEAVKIWGLAAAFGLPVIPHAGQMHNYHLVMSHLNSPMAEYLPPKGGGGILDDDTLFYEIFVGEPIASDGYINLGDRPGIGLELNMDRIREWKA
jgi:L-rhamnonate dehydratase